MIFWVMADKGDIAEEQMLLEKIEQALSFRPRPIVEGKPPGNTAAPREGLVVPSSDCIWNV